MKSLPLLALLSFTVLACSRTLPGEQYCLKQIIEVDGRQGVACDGEHYYVSGSTALYRYDLDGTLQAQNLSPFDSLELECNHIGDIDVYDGKIYAGCEWFMDGVGKNIQIAVYDAKTLRYKYSIPWNQDSGQVECCGLAVDPSRLQVWMADWVDGSRLYCYDLVSGNYSHALTLRPDRSVPGGEVALQQGIVFLDGKILISCDDGDAEKGEADRLYIADPVSGKVSLWRVMDDFLLAGEIEGLTVNPLSGDLIVLSNRGARIVKGMPRGFYPLYQREIHDLYVYGK